jgi:hypothetical protein
MPQGGATLEQAASVRHYLMKEPFSGDELLHYRYTRRKKELVDFDASESGMTAYFCARYENQKGKFGTWGNGGIGDYSIMENQVAITAGTGATPQTPPHFL